MTAIADPNVDRARSVAAVYGIECVEPSLEALLEADVEAVVNLTPIPLHYRTSKAMLEHLADCLRDGTQPLLSAAHARHVLEIMLAARRSAAEGVAVELTTTS